MSGFAVVSKRNVQLIISINTFYVWIASEDVTQDIHQHLVKPVNDKRLKFRVSQEDRRTSLNGKIRETNSASGLPESHILS